MLLDHLRVVGSKETLGKASAVKDGSWKDLPAKTVNMPVMASNLNRIGIHLVLNLVINVVQRKQKLLTFFYILTDKRNVQCEQVGGTACTVKRTVQL